ncbi:MAG: cytochrome c oxidase assembly protein [Paracoccaceae bacterium]|nr:cytochrome c oxidase assembly protein [Paracoccaceae bacterium]
MIGWYRRLPDTKKTLVQTLGLVAVMASLGWAAVPLYDLFCRVTGYGGTTAVASGEGVEVLDRTIKVRFDASLEAGMPWHFRPMQREMEIRIGEVALAFYEAENPTDRIVAGSASYNVTPYAAGGFFTKIDCFCFEQQVLGPGERIEMPVTFYVDPAMVTDRDGKFVNEITLSYTFHEIELSETAALAAGEGEAATN